MIKKRTDIHAETEERWFRVKGYPKSGRDPNPKKETKDFLLTVQVTGSFFDLMQEASNILHRDHDFFPVQIVSHSKKQETL